MDSVINKYNPGGVDDATLRRTGTGGFLSGGYLRDDPLEAYLGNEETAVFVLSNRAFGVEYEHETRGETTHRRPGEGYRAFLLVTDARLLFVVGDTAGSGDYSASVPLVDVAFVRDNAGVIVGELVVVTDTGMRWRFECRGDLGPVTEYLEAATTTWTRVESRLESARKQLVDASQYVESQAYDDAMAAVRSAMAETDAARRRARGFCGDGVPRIDAHIERVEDRTRDVRRRVLRSRAAHYVDTAEAHWRQDDYDAAHRAYSDARADYLEAADLVDGDTEAQLRETAARVERNLSYLERAPIDRARAASRRAQEADGPDARIHYLECALDRYRRALALDWGEDVKRFECDIDEVRDRVDDVAAELVEARSDRATEHVTAAEAHVREDRYPEAYAAYGEAREMLEAALDVARELLPGSVASMTERLEAVDQRRSEVERRLDGASTVTERDVEA